MLEHFDYSLTVLVLGITFLAAAALPKIIRNSFISLPMVFVGAGMAIPFIWPGSPRFDPMMNGEVVERMAELAVIISLMSAGLKLDRKIGWKSWQSTWRLLGIVMPVCIVLLAIGGVAIGLPVAAALLLGAVIAPTDPVLASSVQVGPPGEENEDESRFALTSEAGLNDGLAFPFVNLAILFAASGTAAGISLGNFFDWLWVDVLWKISAGIGMGVIIGRVVAFVVFRVCRPTPMADGFIAIALTLVAYGGTEMVHGYGFLAVFVAALVFRFYERDHVYHKSFHDFSEQIEQLLMVVILVGFGAAISHGLFAPLTWPAVLLALAFLLLIRPLAGLLGLAKTDATPSQRFAVSLLGIRGIGTFYYLAHALNHGFITEYEGRMIWAISGLIVLISIVFHGITAQRVMRRALKN